MPKTEKNSALADSLKRKFQISKILTNDSKPKDGQEPKGN